MRASGTCWRHRTVMLLMIVACAVPSLAARQAPPPAPAADTTPPVDFNRQIRPLLSDRCFRCHGPDASKRKAKLRLDTRDGLFKDLEAGMAVVTPGDQVRSEMLRRIQLPSDDEDVMPPADAHLALTPTEKALLARWVSEGAPYRAHWSWEPVASPPVPSLTDAGHQFLIWQLAGDLLPNATREQRIATAFNRLHRQTNEGGSIEEEFRTEYVADRVNTFGTAMLGLTLECARCHDHKFDAITQRDYFSLFAFFNSFDESGLYSHFTNATPSPSLLLWPSHEQDAHRQVQRRIAATEEQLRQVGRTSEPRFRAWRATATTTITPPAPIAYLAFDTVVGDTTPDAASKAVATLQDGPALVDDPEASGGRALRFNGDNAVVHKTLRQFSRTDAFSISIRIKPTETQPRAVVLHQSRAWSDAGSRGFELTLEDGRPFFGLIHFWPGNVIGVRARDPLPLGRWSSLVITYDGSSRAEGIVIYANGAPVPASRRRESSRNVWSVRTRTTRRLATEKHSSN